MKTLILVLALSVAGLSSMAYWKPAGVNTSDRCQCIGIGTEQRGGDNSKMKHQNGWQLFGENMYVLFSRLMLY